MTESTARAERYDLQTSPSSFFLWEVPQKPVAVRIPNELIDRLEREAVDGFRSVTSRGSEIGGLLLGDAAPGSPTLVSIAGYQLVECEYTRGPLYRLSEADIERMQRAIEQCRAGGAGIAGFFRTHTRKGISLDIDDLAVMDAHFREPHQIGLLVRPFATKASTAGIFIRENGKVSGDASYLEFPFRSGAAAGKPSVEGSTAKAAPNGPAPQAPRPVTRAQIVPIASRREISLPTPSAAAVSPAPAVEEKAATAPVVEEKPLVQPAPAKVEKPAAKEKVEKPVAKEPAKPVNAAPAAPAKPAPAKPVSAKPAVPEPAQHSGKALKLVLGALALSVIGVVLFVYPGFLRRPARPATAANVDISTLQLRAERSNGDLLLTWNRDSEAIRTATKAVLNIFDGAQHENVEMDLAQLRNGSIVYSPQTGDVSFKMEVTGSGQNKTTSESVRVLRTRPSPLQDQPAAQATGATNPNPAAPKPVDTATPAPSADASAEPELKQQPVLPTKPFRAESLGQRLRPAQSNDLPDAPTVGGPIASAAIPGMAVTTSAAAPLPTAPATPVTAESKTNLKSGGQIQQAVLVIKKDPEYPKLARQTGARGIVKLTATVGTDGKVKSVKVLSGHPMLQAAAKDAVKQWVYKPTLLNGQPVETDTEIVLNFLGDK